MMEIDSPDEAELVTQLIRAAENGQAEVAESLIKLALNAVGRCHARAWAR